MTIAAEKTPQQLFQERDIAETRARLAAVRSLSKSN